MLAKQLLRLEAKFIAGAANVQRIPSYALPEIAFIGKSNVGKSSLINAVVNRRNLAIVSHTPGRTQQINFFSVSNKLILVDLPGYGFAKVPGYVKHKWEKLIIHYLKLRSNLRLVNVLIDARRGIKPHDIEVIKLLNSYDRTFQVVFTKADQVSRIDDLVNSSQTLLCDLGHSCSIITTSSRNGHGLVELRNSIVLS